MQKVLYDAIKSQCLSLLPEIKFIAVWNQQVEREREGQDYSFLHPALFIEFPNDTPCDVVGNNVRVYDPFSLVFHIVDNRLDNMDGTQEQNFQAFDLKQKVKSIFQLFKTNGSSSFNCTAESADNDHDNLYHFLQTYTLTWTDQQDSLPIGGYLDTAPHTTVITPTVIH